MDGDRMTRFDGALYEAAANEGRQQQRSARQQLEHWARLGRQLSAHETATGRRIGASVRGEVPLSQLSGERLVANVELDVAIRERAAGESFGRKLLLTGMGAAALDDSGVLTQFFPDGSSSPL